MSHDGIRFVSQAESQREASRPQLTGDALSPRKVRVDKTGGTGMQIDWRDGHASTWTFAWLRAACPCATCHEARENAGLEPGMTPAKPAAVFTMYEAPPRPLEVEPVGKYALRFKWNDGHEAGLYSWDYLRNVCDPALHAQQTSGSTMQP